MSEDKKEHFIRNNKSKNYTSTVKAVYNMVKSKYSYKARINQLVDILRESLGIKEFAIYDNRLVQNGTFDSYCMNKLLDFMNGKDVDFTELYDAILISGDFLESEKKMLERCDVEERLWAILLAMSSPENSI
jgi:hypothetical protein